MERDSCLSRNGLCRFVAAFILVFVGTLFLAGWQGWFRYSKYAADQFQIRVVLQDGREIELSSGQQLRVLKSTNRVDIESADETTRTLIFNPREVSIKPR